METETPIKTEEMGPGSSNAGQPQDNGSINGENSGYAILQGKAQNYFF